jgi:ribosomal protein S18 acetylase RimI-like enzyme
MTSEPGEHPLDNAAWHALRTQHADLAEVKGRARRYPVDVSIFSGVDVVDDEAWEDLAALAGPGGAVTLFRGGIPTPPAGWTERVRGQGRQLTVTADALAGRSDDADHAVDAARFRRLDGDDIGEVLALVALTRPGPFVERTLEMGRYWGSFDGHGGLEAMAGERLHLDGFTEISAVCTHPDARGRGLAAVLTRHVALGIVKRDETPFLHVVVGNEPARRVYERLGFTERRLVEFADLDAPLV